MAQQTMDKIAIQTRDIMTAYLRVSGNLTGSYERLGDEIGSESMPAGEVNRIAGSLRDLSQNDNIRTESQRNAQQVPENATIQFIGNFLQTQFFTKGEVDWTKIITLATTVGAIVNRTHMMDAQVLLLVGEVAMMIGDQTTDWIESQGGWSSVVEYIDNMDTTTKVLGAAGIMTAVGAAGYLLYQLFNKDPQDTKKNKK